MARESPKQIGQIEIENGFYVPVYETDGNKKYDYNNNQSNIERNQTMSKFNFNSKPVEKPVEPKPAMTVEGFQLAQSIEKQIKEGFSHIVADMGKSNVQLETLFKKVSKLENQVETLINLIQKVSVAEVKPVANNNKSVAEIKPVVDPLNQWIKVTKLDKETIIAMIDQYCDDSNFDLAVFEALGESFDPDKGSEFIEFLADQHTNKNKLIVRKAEKTSAAIKSDMSIYPFGPSVPAEAKETIIAGIRTACHSFEDLKAFWGRCRKGEGVWHGMFCAPVKLSDFWEAIESNK